MTAVWYDAFALTSEIKILRKKTPNLSLLLCKLVINSEAETTWSIATIYYRCYFFEFECSFFFLQDKLKEKQVLHYSKRVGERKGRKNIDVMTHFTAATATRISHPSRYVRHSVYIQSRHSAGEMCACIISHPFNARDEKCELREERNAIIKSKRSAINNLRWRQKEFSPTFWWLVMFKETRNTKPVSHFPMQKMCVWRLMQFIAVRRSFVSQWYRISLKPPHRCVRDQARVSLSSGKITNFVMVRSD